MFNMKKGLLAAVALGLLVWAPAPAQADWKADCAAEIKKLDDRMDFMNSNHGKIEQIRTMIDSAKDGLEKGKKKKCQKMAKKTANVLDRIGY